ncbi:MAG: MotA/TolQ/ExbB proton channel family protein [Pirellulaceae bacterium]|nr:MotA/TolQ/ExbB proton channel family protein [Planctomycetales bacterium]
MHHGFYLGSTRNLRMRRLPLFLVLSLVILACSQLLHAPSLTTSAHAQDDEGFAEPAGEPAADPAPPAGGNGGTKAPANNSAPRNSADQESLLGWYYKALGWFYSLVFLGLSFTLVALVIMNILSARRENVCPVQLVEGFEAHLNERRYQEAFDLAKADESFLGQVLAAGLAKLSSGYAQSIEAMQEVGEEENMKLEHRLSYIALIGTLSPMVGLLGTVQGMIKSFRVIVVSGASPDPRELADGISTALITTLFGLFIAIPAIAIYNILKNRVSRLVLEVGILSEGLMSRFQNVGDKNG